MSQVSGAHLRGFAPRPSQSRLQQINYSIVKFTLETNSANSDYLLIFQGILFPQFPKTVLSPHKTVSPSTAS